MTIANSNVIAKIAAVVAGLGLVAMSFAAPAAKASTTSDQAAQIAALQAQLAALQSQSTTSQTTTTTTASFTVNLTVGSKGASVMALQNWLIGKGYSIPAGATGTFGAQTKAAVMAWQAASGVSPVSGFFGPISRAKANASGSTTTGTTTTTTTTGSTGLSGGEATLNNYQLVSESGTLRQGVTGAQIASAKFDVKDGDVSLQRASLDFQATNTSLDVKPWKYIKSVSVWDGSKKLATVDASTQGAWSVSNADSTHLAPGASKYYTISLTGLNDVIKQNTTGNRLTFSVDTQSSIDTANAAQTFWVDVPTQGIRAIDSAGINQYVGNDTVHVVASVSAAQNGKLTISEASTDPLASVLVGDPTNTTSGLTVFAFTARNTQASDAKITDLTFNVATTSASGSSAANITNIVRKATLSLGGSNYDGTINSNNTVTFTNMTGIVPGNGTLTGTLTVDIFGQTGHYAATGESLAVSLVGGGANVTAENASTGDAVGSANISGTAVGNQQTLAVSGGINVVGASTNNTSGAAVLTYNSQTPTSSYGTFTLNYNVTAVGQDVYVPKTIATTGATFGAAASTTYAGAIINTGMNASTTSATVTATLTTTAKSDNANFYVVRAGATETFTATVTINPNGTSTDAGDFQVGLDKVQFSTVDTSLNSLQTLNVDETNSSFHTPPLHIVG